MNEEYLRNCSYRELKQIAIENDILKGVKSKKKDVLLQRIKNFFSIGASIKDHDINAFDNEEATLEIPPKKKNKKIKSDTTEVNEKNITFGIESDGNSKVLSVDQNCENIAPLKKGRKRGKKLDLTLNLTTESSEDNDVPHEKSQKSNGRKTRSKDFSGNSTSKQILNLNNVSGEDLKPEENRRGTFTLTSSKEPPSSSYSPSQSRNKKQKVSELDSSRNKNTTEVNEKNITFDTESDVNSKVLPVDENCENTVPLKKGRRKRGKKLDLTLNLTTESSEDNNVPPKKSQKSNGRKTRSKDSSGNSTSKVTFNKNNVSGEDLKPEENRRGTFTLASSNESTSSFYSPSQSQNKKQRVSDLNSSRSKNATEVNEKNITFDIESDENSKVLPVDQNCENTKPLKNGRKRGKKLDLTLNLTTEFSKDNDVPPEKSLKTNGRKTRSKDSSGNSTSQEVLNLNNVSGGPVPEENRRETFSVASKSPLLCSPLLTNQSQAKSKVAKLVRDTANIINKTVNFLTPDNKKNTPRNTPKRSNVALTPHPAKKSLSTPLPKKSISSPFSVKKTPGQFSARKMPNFAKIHQKSFKKMESLVQYSERKIARAEFLSPLKGSTVQNKMIKRQSDVIGKKPSKSLIPIRSKVSLKDDTKIKAFGNKTHLTCVDTIREKEKNIIKGVRANKRFLLQMKMRGLET